VFVHVLRHGFCSGRVARHGISQCCFDVDGLTGGGQFQAICRRLLRFDQIAKGSFAQSGILVPEV